MILIVPGSSDPSLYRKSMILVVPGSSHPSLYKGGACPQRQGMPQAHPRDAILAPGYNGSITESAPWLKDHILRNIERSAFATLMPTL